MVSEGDGRPWSQASIKEEDYNGGLCYHTVVVKLQLTNLSCTKLKRRCSKKIVLENFAISDY